jgi:hypothetical protein
MQIMLSKYKYLVLVLAAAILFVPKPTLALWGVGDFGIFDIPDQILGGIEEKTGPVFTAVTTLLIAYMAGLAALSLTGEYLERFIYQQDSMMTALEPMTRAGWDFSAGLANMLLVLIFLIIAFAFILKIETFQAKKSLPKLLGVALLINFSFLFVQMLIDLSQILYNTVLPKEPIFSTIMDVLISPGESVIATVIAWVAAMGVSLAIPMVNAFVQILISTLFTVFLLPNIVIWTIQAFFFWLLAAMFFFFIFLFGARVFVFQMLIIVAPLAFVCLILPKTEKFWQQWFKILTEWLLLGIFFLFFLVLGFGSLSLMRPSVDALPLPGASLFKLGGFLAYYFVVFIYMAVILFIGKKFIPSGAQALMDFGKGIAGTVVTRGLKPIGKQLKERTAPQVGEGVRERLAKSERVQDFANKLAISTPKLKGLGKIAAPIASPIWAVGRGLGRSLGSESIEETKAAVAQTESKAQKMDEKTIASHLKGSIPLREKVGYINAAIKNNKIDDLKKEYGKNFDGDIEKIYEQAKKMDAHKEIESAFPHMIPDEDLKRSYVASDQGIKESEVTPEQINAVTKEQVEKQRISIFQKMRPDRAKQISRESLGHRETVVAMVKAWDGRQIGNLISQHGKFGVEKIEETIREQAGEGKNPIEWLKDKNGGNNMALAKYFETQAGQAAGFSFETTSKETPKETPKEAPKIYPGTEEEFRKAREERKKKES